MIFEIIQYYFDGLNHPCLIISVNKRRVKDIIYFNISPKRIQIAILFLFSSSFFMRERRKFCYVACFLIYNSRIRNIQASLRKSSFEIFSFILCCVYIKYPMFPPLMSLEIVVSGKVSFDFKSNAIWRGRLFFKRICIRSQKFSRHTKRTNNLVG